MQGTHQTRTRSRNRRQEAEGGPATRSGTRELPPWESFPREDRHRLVRTILQAARRQVEAGPGSGRPRR